MANQFVQIAPDSTGKKVQVYENVIGGQTVEAQATVPVDVSGLPLHSTVGSAAPVSGLLVGGSDGTNLRALSTDNTGRLNVTSGAATGAAPPANAIFLGASDGANLQGLLVESSSAKNLRVSLYQGANEATVTTFHNADNQSLGGTAFGLLSGGVAQLLNVAGNLDRQRETSVDNVPSRGVASGTQQLASPFSTTSTTTVAPGSVVVTPVAMSGTSRGSPWSIQVGSSIKVVDANPEVVWVTAVTSTTFTATFAFSHGPSSYTLSSYTYNQARDATLADGSTGEGLGGGATFLFNTTYNAGAGGWEAERSALGEQDGATGVGTAIAAEYEFNSGGPGATGSQFDRARNLQGKGLGTGTINAGGGSGSTSVTMNAVPTGLQPGSPVYFLGGTAEVAYTTAAYVAGANPILLQSALVNTHANSSAVNWDVYAALGPGLNGFQPTGVGIEEEALYDPVSGLFYIERAATQDAMPAVNVVAEAPALYNGTTLDRARSGAAANLSAFSSLGSELCTHPGNWAVSAQATAGTPSASRASGGAGVRHVCNAVSIVVSAGATAQTPVIVNLRDGATGAGTILHTWALSTPANGMGVVAVSDLNIVGSAATAMTLEFASATASAVIGSVNLCGYDCQ